MGHVVEGEGDGLQPAGEPAEGQAAARDGSQGRQAPRLLAWLASLATVLLLMASLFLERGENAPLRLVGVALLALSSLFIFVPFWLLASQAQSHGGETYMQTGVVVDRGLYAVVRHPQYLGYMLLACGFGLLSQHWLAVVLAVLVVVCFYLQGVQEEGYCLAQFGDAYARYLRQVPRFNALLGLVRLLRRGRG